MRNEAAWVRGLSLLLLVVGGGLVAWGAAANAFGLDEGPGHVRRQIRFLRHPGHDLSAFRRQKMIHRGHLEPVHR